MEKTVEEILGTFKEEMKEIIGYDIEVMYNVLNNNIQGDLFQILTAVSTCCMVTIDQMQSSRRYREYVEARQIYCKLAKERTKHSLETISKAINRGHSDAIHSIRTCTNLIETNINFKTKYDECANFKQ